MTMSTNGTPQRVQAPDLDGSVTVIAVGDLHSCAVQRGAAWCWGDNGNSQLGSGSAVSRSSVPVSVRGLDSGVTAIAAGSQHTCAIHYGVTKCWGSGSDGRLGTGSNESFNTPRQVKGLSFAPPSQLRAGTVTGYSIAVSWSPLVLGVPAITSYLISWGTDLEDEKGLRTASVSVPTTNYVVPGLRAETSYQIAVAGVNRAGIGSRTTLTIQTAQAELLPSAPQNLGIDGATTNTLVVSWEPPNFDGGELTTYTISWDVSTPIVGVSTAVSIAASENDYEITGLLPNRLYYIVVTAANSIGPGVGASITPQTAALLPVPPLVMVPTGEDVMLDQLKISWEASSRGSDGAEITGYIVYWTAFGRTLELRSTVNAPITSYVITGLDVKTRYHITVAAVNRSGVGRRSTLLEARTLGLAAMEAQAIAAGVRHSCAVYNDAARCWGRNDLGQLGRGKFNLNEPLNEPIPDLVKDLDSGVTAISASHNHTCAIQDAAAKCWGIGDSGQLGNNSEVNSATPVRVLGLDGGVTAIAAGKSHSCAIVNAAAKCWGSGSSGELGDGSLENYSTPVQVYGLDRDVTAIVTGDSYSCAIVDAAAKCWGLGASGQLGVGSRERHSTPVQVDGLDNNVTAIAAGDSAACAVQHGVAWCWGRGGSGELGNGMTRTRTTPQQVEVLGLDSSVTVIAVGSFHSCAVQRGAAWCWGNNGFGVLGSVSVGSMSSIPVLVEDIDSGVTAIAAGRSHTCAIQYGVTKCWGFGRSGQLGVDTEANRNPPLVVTEQSFAPPPQLLLRTVTSSSIAVSWSPLVLAAGVPAITSYLISWGTDLEDEEGLST